MWNPHCFSAFFKLSFLKDQDHEVQKKNNISFLFSQFLMCWSEGRDV